MLICKLTRQEELGWEALAPRGAHPWASNQEEPGFSLPCSKQAPSFTYGMAWSPRSAVPPLYFPGFGGGWPHPSLLTDT